MSRNASRRKKHTRNHLTLTPTLTLILIFRKESMVQGLSRGVRAEDVSGCVEETLMRQQIKLEELENFIKIRTSKVDSTYI